MSPVFKSRLQVDPFTYSAGFEGSFDNFQHMQRMFGSDERLNTPDKRSGYDCRPLL